MAGSPSYKAGQDAGLYVWREANGVFRIRLTGGGKAQNVTGGFSATQPLSWLINVGTESNDKVARIRPAQVEFDLKTSTSDYVDGIDFAVPAGAGVCLWGWGTLSKTVYVGAKATPLTMPVDLLNNGACGAAAALDGEPSYKAGRDAGVYVWREANGTFRVRLTSGGKAQNAIGGFSATKPFHWVAPIATEANDVVRKIRPAQVEFDLKTSTSDYIDGIDFAVPADTGVCLWGWGTLGKTVYLGAGATPFTTPVDLLGNGACAGGDGGNTLKYNPGHYISMNDWEGQAAMIEAASKPGVKGVLVRYLWKDLEPAFGKYDFSKIESDLKLMADHGMQLIARIEDKSFKPDVMPTPVYLWAGYTVPHNNWRGGYVAKRWLPYVTERMAALTKAMGARFDSHPNFEGVTFEESALGFTAAMQQAYGYSPEKYRDETIKMLKNTRAHFPRSQVFWSMNFLEGGQPYIGEIAEAVAPLKIAMGGPDVLPDDWALGFHTYPYYAQFKDKMVLFGSVQYVGYNHLRADRRTKYWTMPNLFAFARDKLHVKYVFWTQKRTPDPWDSYDWTHALPVIRNNPSFNQ